jgi:hypothetical protein
VRLIALVLMATGQNDEKLRAGIWLSQQRHDAKVMMRRQRESHFAESLSRCDWYSHI